MAAKSNQKRQSAPRTRREKLESREAAILDVAQKMIAERGFRKTTTAEIAAAADVAEGTLYLYFKNKEALGRAVLADFYRRLTENARRGVGKLTDTREKLAFLARHHLKNVIRERRILELVYMQNPFETEERAAFRETVRRWVENEVTPFADEWDEAGEVPWGLHEKAGALGAFGFGVSEKYGGLGFDDCFMTISPAARRLY